MTQIYVLLQPVAMTGCQLGPCVLLQCACRYIAHHNLKRRVNYYNNCYCLSCRGAAEGEGLGNAFLSHIQAVDGIFHVCRGFEDPEVTHVEDRVDPVEDLEIIHKYDPASKQCG